MPCLISADRLVGGEWLCHIHDPGGVYRCQQTAKKMPGDGKGRQVALMDIQRQEQMDLDLFPIETPRLPYLTYRRIDGAMWVKLPPWPVTIKRSETDVLFRSS